MSTAPARTSRSGESGNPLGVSRVLIFLPPAPAEVVVPLLDEYRPLIDTG